MGSARLTKAEKLTLATTLRDAALIVVKRAGTMGSTAGLSGRHLSWHHGAISISYRAPFNRVPSVGEDLKYRAASLGMSVPATLAYGLDVWAPKKVLCIEWDDQGGVVLVSLRRGEWEAELFRAATDAP